MEKPNYDSDSDGENKYKQLYSYMSLDTFRMLICGNSGSGKTNLLYHMLMKALIYNDEIYLYAKNLQQEKYQKLIRKMREMSKEVGYDMLNVSNDKIIPVSEMDYEDNQKLVIFHDYVCEKNQRRLIILFKDDIKIARLSISVKVLQNTKDSRFNCSHYCVYEFPSSRERNMI